MPEEKKKLTAYSVVVGLAVLLLCAGIPAVFGLAWAPNCASCHKQDTARIAAPRTTHQTVACLQCHADANYPSKVGMRQRVWYQMVLRVVPVKSFPVPPLENARCESCHKEIYESDTTSQSIHITHTNCSKDQSCVSCHAQTPHGNRAGRWASRYDMDACLNCHLESQTFTPSDCAKCHVEGGAGAEAVAASSGAHPQGWDTTHGAGDQATCRACHEVRYCAPCHGEGVPHSNYFISFHGAMADKPDNKCASCHTNKDFCDSCHGIEMPHPESFLADHSATVAQGGKTLCSNCHLPKDCSTCHEGHVHAGGVSPQ